MFFIYSWAVGQNIRVVSRVTFFPTWCWVTRVSIVRKRFYWKLYLFYDLTLKVWQLGSFTSATFF